MDNGLYGVDQASAAIKFDQQDLDFDCKDAVDPLHGFPLLNHIRGVFLSTSVPEYVETISSNDCVKDVTAFQRFGKQVQDYIHFKVVNEQLLVCAAYYRIQGVEDYDWDGFVRDSNLQDCVIRSHLKRCFQGDILDSSQ